MEFAAIPQRALTWAQTDPMAPWWAGGAAVGVVLIVGWVLWSMVRRRLFVRRLRAAVANPGLAGSLVRERYGPGALLRRSAVIERLAERDGPAVIELTGIQHLWVERLGRRKRPADLARVLRFAPDAGLFEALLAVQERPALAPALMRWLDDDGDLLKLRQLALASRGRPFDGAQARRLFMAKLDQVREMTGDPEWWARLFAIRILLQDNEARTLPALWAALEDTHPMVRLAVVQGFRPDDGPRLMTTLQEMVLRDPAYEVRRAAWARLQRDHEGRLALDVDTLDDVAAQHLLEQMPTGSTAAESTALGYLRSENLELRLLAARLLDKCGALRRLCLAADFSDREGLERSRELLAAAMSVDVTGFLEPCIRDAQHPAALYLCAKLLAGAANRPQLAAALARRVFALPVAGEVWPDVYGAALDCLGAAGDAEGLRLLATELEARRGDVRPLALLLERLPERAAPYVLPMLTRQFQNEAHPLRDGVRDALKRMPTALVVPPLLDWLYQAWDATAPAVRVDTVRLLAELKLPYAVELVLEHLWLLPPKDARAVLQVMPQYDPALLKAKAERLLGTTDARMRAALLSALPATGDSAYMVHAQDALTDVDPDVRIAAVWALTEFPDFDWGGQGAALLRDPVERVRGEVARALGAVAGSGLFAALRERLVDAEEALSVKEAAVRALGRSEQPRAVDMLVERLEQDEALREVTATALAGKVQPNGLKRLLEHFKDAQPDLRERLKDVFLRMGERGGYAMAELLQEDLASLRPLILEVLDASGHLEWQVRRLNHKDATLRREAATFLTKVGTLPALRGLVLAAKDPDEAVRVQVVRALERLAVDPNNALLQSLRNDPVRKVRTYTTWALERLRARTL